MIVQYGALQDIDSWMQLVQRVRWNFPGLETEAALDDSVLSGLVSNIEYQEIVSVITDIPSPYNEVLYLHFVKDYSIKKTATLLDKKTATVKMQLVRGKKILIDKLSEVFYG